MSFFNTGEGSAVKATWEKAGSKKLTDSGIWMNHMTSDQGGEGFPISRKNQAGTYDSLWLSDQDVVELAKQLNALIESKVADEA